MASGYGSRSTSRGIALEHDVAVASIGLSHLVGNVCREPLDDLVLAALECNGSHALLEFDPAKGVVDALVCLVVLILERNGKGECALCVGSLL